MFLLRRPDEARLAEWLAQARDLPLSYAPVGLARGAPPPGFRVEEERAVLGRGAAVYGRAVKALQEWRQFELGWASVYPRRRGVEVGAEVLVLASHVGFWSVHACRVVYVLQGQRVAGAVAGGQATNSQVGEGNQSSGGHAPQGHHAPQGQATNSKVAEAEDGSGGRPPDPIDQEVSGFAYGTLSEHAEVGEEIFQVSHDRASGEVTYLVRAVSREQALLARLGFPIARALQNRFRRDSARAIQRAIAQTAT